MSHIITFIIVDSIVALLFICKSRFVNTLVTSAVWSVHMALGALTLATPSYPAWKSIMFDPSPETMLAVAAATLALLLFTANFFDNSAKPAIAAESYFNIHLDTYLSRKSWITTVLLAPSFQVMVVSLFAIPVIVPALAQIGPDFRRVTTAIWIAALALVFAILLLNALTALHVSLMRLVRRHAILRKIREEATSDWLKMFKLLLRGTNNISARELVGEYLLAMKKMPMEQQIHFLRDTVAHHSFKAHMESRLTRARRLNSRPYFRLWVSESANGNFGSPMDQAENILHTIYRVETGRAAAFGHAIPEITNEQLRAALFTELVACANRMNRQWQYLENTRMSKTWLGYHIPLDGGMSRYLFHPYGQAEEPEVLRPVMAILERLIELRFPPKGPTRCSEESLNPLINAVQATQHEETRKRLTHLLADAIVRATIIDRHIQEQLPLDLVCQKCSGRQVTRPWDKGIQKALMRSAFSAAMSDEVTEVARRALLRLLDENQVMSTFIHALMYRYRNHEHADPEFLRPFIDYFNQFYYYRDFEGIDREKLRQLSRGGIEYFLTTDDVDWMLDALKIPADADFITSYLRHTHSTKSWLPLEAVLIFHGTVKNITYGSYLRDIPRAIPASWDFVPRHTVQEAAKILDATAEGRGRFLLHNNPWINDDIQQS